VALQPHTLSPSRLNTQVPVHTRTSTVPQRRLSYSIYSSMGTSAGLKLVCAMSQINQPTPVLPSPIHWHLLCSPFSPFLYQVWHEGLYSAMPRLENKKRKRKRNQAAGQLSKWPKPPDIDIFRREFNRPGLEQYVEQGPPTLTQVVYKLDSLIEHFPFTWNMTVIFKDN